MANVTSINNGVVKLKELGLLNVEVTNQSGIDMVLQSIIRSFEVFRLKYKGKEDCPSSELVSGVVESMVKLQHGMDVGSTSYLEPKGEKDKKETNKLRWQGFCHRCV